MARRKLSRVLDLEKGNTRLAAVKSIDPAPPLWHYAPIDFDILEAHPQHQQVHQLWQQDNIQH